MKRKLTTLCLLALIPLTLFAVQSGTLVGDGNTDIGWARGTRGTVEFSGDFGGGTVTLLYLVGSTYVPFTDSAGSDISFTDDDGVEFVCWSNSIRITVAGSTTPDIDYHIGRIRN